MQQNQIQDTLQLRRVTIDTYKENVAYLNGDFEDLSGRGIPGSLQDQSKYTN